MHVNKCSYTNKQVTERQNENVLQNLTLKSQFTLKKMDIAQIYNSRKYNCKTIKSEELNLSYSSFVHKG